MWWLVVAVVVFLCLILYWLQFGWVMRWVERETQGLKYYGRPLEERRRFKQRLHTYQRWFAPLLRAMERSTRIPMKSLSFRFRDITGPMGMCREDDFAKAVAYQPSAEDVFVVTQMKCGTTWMQQVVLQVLSRGTDQFAERGEALYAHSPWIESSKTVSLEQASLFGSGENQYRLIKTHMPQHLCPFNEQAKYVYVVRRPGACFASCVDFVNANLGPFVPPLEELESWFRSDDQMWWGTWAKHVAGWLTAARTNENILVVSFEQMKQDPTASTQRIATFLGVNDLADDEIERIIQHSSFAFMQQHADCFEMHPPHLLQPQGKFFVSGRIDRHADVPLDVVTRIELECESVLSQLGLHEEEIRLAMGRTNVLPKLAPAEVAVVNTGIDF